MKSKNSIHFGERSNEGGEMGRRGERVTDSQVGYFVWRFPVIAFFQVCVVLSGVMILMPTDTGWGKEKRKVLVSSWERPTHPARPERMARKWKFDEPHRVNVVYHERRTIVVADSSSRTSRSLVNTVMALLATFEGAGVLPPEGTAQANQIIHALIQLQSAVIKTSDPTLQLLLEEAIRIKMGKNWEETYRSLPRTGLTSLVFEALVTYDSQFALWKQDGVEQAFRQFNLTQEDWVVVKTIFLNARDVYTQQGGSIHDAFSGWVKKMS